MTSDDQWRRRRRTGESLVGPISRGLVAGRRVAITRFDKCFLPPWCLGVVSRTRAHALAFADPPRSRFRPLFDGADGAAAGVVDSGASFAAGRSSTHPRKETLSFVAPSTNRIARLSLPRDVVGRGARPGVPPAGARPAPRLVHRRPARRLMHYKLDQLRGRVRLGDDGPRPERLHLARDRRPRDVVEHHDAQLQRPASDGLRARHHARPK